MPVLDLARSLRSAQVRARPAIHGRRPRGDRWSGSALSYAARAAGVQSPPGPTGRGAAAGAAAWRAPRASGVVWLVSAMTLPVSLSPYMQQAPDWRLGGGKERTWQAGRGSTDYSFRTPGQQALPGADWPWPRRRLLPIEGTTRPGGKPLLWPGRRRGWKVQAIRQQTHDEGNSCHAQAHHQDRTLHP
jgi:hypothetical protein